MWYNSLHMLAGVAGFCCTALLLKMPFTFTNKEYDYIYFIYTLSSGSCRAAVTEYQWQYPGCWVTKFQNFERYWFILMSECFREDIVLNAVQQNPHKVYKKNFHVDWCCTDSMQDYVHCLFLSVSFLKRTKHKYWEIIPAVYNSVNGYKHNYKLCLTFCS